MNADQISYALAKQVPDMRRGFTIETTYGSISFGPDMEGEAEEVANLVRVLLENKLEYLKGTN